MDLPILQDIVIILGLSILSILLFQRLRLPAILGFLLTGVIVGPHGLNLIKAVHEVELLSEIGIIFLLFVIGIEFSLKGIFSIKKTVLVGGMIQVGGTIGLVALITSGLGLPLQSAVFMGFLLSMSSTAIVLKMLQEQGELTAPHGRVSLAILIFQDIVVVLLVLLTPILAGQSDDPTRELLWLLVKVTGVIIAVVLLSRFIIPVLFRAVVRSKSRELFILTVVVVCFATAWLTSSIGLSLALGAFFAGLIISESEYSHQANANILPFREIFISFFFVSVGMLLDLSFFINHIVFIHLAALGVILLKMFVIALAVYVLRYSPRTIILTALAIFQVGEFAFLLSSTGMKYQLLSEDIYQYFLAISIISMGATPFIINFAPRIARHILQAPLPAPLRDRLNAITRSQADSAGTPEEQPRDHIVIVGFGMNGKNVAKAARAARIPFLVVELDPQVIQKAKSEDFPVIFGDATDETILKHVNIQEARVVVIAISAHDATRQIVKTVRMFTETAYVIVRTRYLREVEVLVKHGADDVIPEEFETSIEIFSHVLRRYLVPNDQIREFVAEIRSHNYEALRSVHGTKTASSHALHIPEMEITTLHVQQGRNKIVGRSIQESELRSNYNITVLAIRRGDVYITRIDPGEVIKQDDILYLFGRPEDVVALNKYFLITP